MKLLAVVAIGVIALIGSPAMSDSKPVYPFKTILCSEIAEASAASYQQYLDLKKTFRELQTPQSVGRMTLKESQDHNKFMKMFIRDWQSSILNATQMATIYAAFCK